MMKPFCGRKLIGSFGTFLPLLLFFVSCRRADVSLDAATHAPPAASKTAVRETALAHHERAIPWIENDWDEAFRLARRDRKRVFVDVWATWCHTCLSMKEFVFSDPRLEAARDKVIWLALDTDRPENASRMKALAAPALPTFYLFDTDKPEALRRVVGSMSVEESLTFVGESTAAPSAYPRVFALYEQKRFAECLTLASTVLPSSPSDDLNTRSLAVTCALEDSPRNAAALRDAVAELSKRANDLRTTVIADDRSGAYEAVVEAMDALLKDQHSGSAQELLQRTKALRDEEVRHWVTFLELEAGAARSPRARAVFDPHRTLAYSAAGTPEKAIPMLLQSSSDFPDDFNPPARLAKVYLELRQLDLAEKAIGTALTKGYGPRKLRLYGTAIDIARAQKNAAREATLLRDALAFSNSFSLSAGYKKLVAGFHARLKELSTR